MHSFRFWLRTPSGWLVLAVIFLLVLLVHLGWRTPVDSAAGVNPAPHFAPIPIRGPGILAPTILFPRHRIFSGSPPIVLAVSWVFDAVRIDVQYSSGFRSHMHSGKRTIPWPESWPVPKIGEVVRLSLHCGGFATDVDFERVEATDLDLTYRDGRRGVPKLLSRGLPSEAWLLGCQDPRVPVQQLLECELRMGLPPSGWRAPPLRR
jgi:hypothetical protein